MISFRPRAVRDIEHHAEYLELHAAGGVADRFRAALMSATQRMEEMPLSGAPRALRNPRLAGLRMWALPGFRNYLLFYLAKDGSVEILRLLHGAQDVEAILELDEE